MEETTGSSFPASTSKICWFNLSSLLFKSSSSSSSASPPQDSQQSSLISSTSSQQQTPASSPTRRRTSPRLSSKTTNSSSSSTLNQCCLASDSKCQCVAATAAVTKTKRRSNKNSQLNSNDKNDKFSSLLSSKDDDSSGGSSDDDESPSLTCMCNADSTSSSNGLNDHVCCQGHRHGGADSDKTKHELTHGLSLKEAPHYLTFNPYITGGYRNNLQPVQCIKSLFWWTNETLNIWSHLLGWVWFFSLSLYDMMGFTNQPKTQPWDQVIFSLLLVCFQACMILSAAYHVFCCCSEQSYRQWLTMDLLGVSLSLLAIYISGIYYAFSCVPFWLNFYLSTVAAIFVCCLTCTFFRSSDGFSNRLFLFGGWACYGIVPTVHWAILHGGSSSAVALLLPRIFWMYAISAAAFFFYVSKLPERWKPGLVNYIGSSHQIWHILIVAALYHWHNTGLLYLDYRSRHPCSEEYAALYKTDPVV